MQRRALLLVLAGLSGCTSRLPDGGPFGLLPGSDSGSEESTPVSTSTPTATPTATSTPTPAALSSTPSEKSLQEMNTEELLEFARLEMEGAIEAYAGAGKALTSVTAASEFDPEPVVERLYAAQIVYEEADRQGISATQRQTIDRLERFERAVRHMIDAQVQLIGAYTDLDDARRALARIDSETANSAIDRSKSRRSRADESTAKLNQAKYEQSVNGLETLSTEAFRTKVAQFRAEINGMTDLIDGVDRVSEGVARLERAHRRDEAGSPYVANDLAMEAEELLQEGINLVREALNRYRPAAGSLEGLSLEFIDVARGRITEARSVYRDG